MGALPFWLFVAGAVLAIVGAWRAPATNFGLFLVGLAGAMAFWHTL